jgi:hypothetical protein
MVDLYLRFIFDYFQELYIFSYIYNIMISDFYFHIFIFIHAICIIFNIIMILLYVIYTI